MPLSLKESICSATRLPRTDAVLKGRARLLATDDRRLIEAVFLNNQPVSMLADIMGISPRGLRSRIRRLCRHMTSRRFLDAARALPYLPPDDARVARMIFCQRLPRAQVADEVGLTVHKLRRRIDRISAQIVTIRRLRRSNGPLGD